MPRSCLVSRQREVFRYRLLHSRGKHRLSPHKGILHSSGCSATWRRRSQGTGVRLGPCGSRKPPVSPPGSGVGAPCTRGPGRILRRTGRGRSRRSGRRRGAEPKLRRVLVGTRNLKQFLFLEYQLGADQSSTTTIKSTAVVAIPNTCSSIRVIIRGSG